MLEILCCVVYDACVDYQRAFMILNLRIILIYLRDIFPVLIAWVRVRVRVRGTFYFVYSQSQIPVAHLKANLTKHMSIAFFLQVCERVGVLWNKLERGKLGGRHVSQFLHLVHC